jgi:hypothetical protein
MNVSSDTAGLISAKEGAGVPSQNLTSMSRGDMHGGMSLFNDASGMLIERPSLLVRGGGESIESRIVSISEDSD